LSGQDSGRVINELAAGAKEGAAEIPDITSALKEFGTVAEIGNVSTSESIALIETLADRQLKGSEAGTQLRNVLSKLASADILPKSAQEQFKKLGIDINILKDSSLPLEKRLRELGKANGDVSALTKIFGLENLQAATIITSGLDKYEQLNKKIQGTHDALFGDIQDLFSVRLHNCLLNYLKFEHKIIPIDAHKLSVLELSKIMRHRSFIQTRNVGPGTVTEMNSFFLAAGLSIM